MRPRWACTLAYLMVPLKSSGFWSYFTCCPPGVLHLVAARNTSECQLKRQDRCGYACLSDGLIVSKNAVQCKMITIKTGCTTSWLRVMLCIAVITGLKHYAGSTLKRTTKGHTRRSMELQQQHNLSCLKMQSASSSTMTCLQKSAG